MSYIEGTWFEAGLSLLPISLQHISNIFTPSHSRTPFSVEGSFPSMSSHLPLPAMTFLHPGCLCFPR